MILCCVNVWLSERLTGAASRLAIPLSSHNEPLARPPAGSGRSEAGTEAGVEAHCPTHCARQWTNSSLAPLGLNISGSWDQPLDHCLSANTHNGKLSFNLANLFLIFHPPTKLCKRKGKFSSLNCLPFPSLASWQYMQKYPIYLEELYRIRQKA